MYHDSTVSMRILPGIMRVSVITFLSLETKYQVLRATNSWDCGNSANKALMHPLLPEEFSCLPETFMAGRVSGQSSLRYRAGRSSSCSVPFITLLNCRLNIRRYGIHDRGADGVERSPLSFGRVRKGQPHRKVRPAIVPVAGSRAPTSLLQLRLWSGV